MLTRTKNKLLPRSLNWRHNHFTSNPTKTTTPHFITSTNNKNKNPTTTTRRKHVMKETCMSLLKNCKTTTHLTQIHSKLHTFGLHNDTAFLCKLMSLLCSTDPKFVGNLRYAERLCDSVRNPCLFLYNVLTKAFAKVGRFKDCVFLFCKLRGVGLWPDNFTYPFVFKAVGFLKEVSLGEELHGFVVKCGVEFDCYVCNSLMDMHGQLGRVDVLRKLFDEMPERELISWNILISGYVKCRMFEDAVTAFRRLRRESGFLPDEATIVSTLSACTALKNLELGREVHGYVRERLEFSSIIGNALLDMYCKCGCLNVAREIFEQMPNRNVICWTSMVAGYVNCGELDEARELFERSPVKDVVLWTAMINGYVQFNRFDDAVSLFREMQYRRIKPDNFMVVALLTGCAQTGALEQGRWIHGYIEENRFPIDAVIGTALIEMYAKCGCVEKSLEIFYGLKEKDTASWTSIICSLANNGRTSKALLLFSDMKAFGAKPDDITFIGILSACSHGGLVEEGQEFFNSMRKIYHIEPKLEHYACLVDLLGRAGRLHEAEELIMEIPDEDSNTTVPLYGSLLSSCRIYGNVEMGERIAQHLMKIASTDSSVHTLLANIYAFVDRWEDVTKVRKNMKDLGVHKVPGCSSIEVDGIIHEFWVRDPSHPKLGEIYFLLNNFVKTLMGSKQIEIEMGDVVAAYV